MKIRFRVRVVTACFICLNLFLSTITVAKIDKKTAVSTDRRANSVTRIYFTSSCYGFRNVHELVYTSCCINQLLLTGVEGCDALVISSFTNG